MNKSSANRIVIRLPQTIPTTVNIKTFLIHIQNTGSLNNSIKLSNPTKSPYPEPLELVKARTKEFIRGYAEKIAIKANHGWRMNIFVQNKSFIYKNTVIFKVLL